MLPTLNEEDKQIPESSTASQSKATPPSNLEADTTTEEHNVKTTEEPANNTKPLRDMSTKEAYFASLEKWVENANISQNAMAFFPWYLLSSYPQIFQNQAGMTAQPSFPFGLGSTTLSGSSEQVQRNAFPAAAPPLNLGNGFRILDERTQHEIINRHGGFEYVIAPFWKRAIAEVIDIVMLLLLKIIVTFTAMNLFDLDLGFDLDKDVLQKAMDDDYYSSFLTRSMDFLAFSSDLLLLEILTKILVCCYEALWTALHNGSTPGKALMNLRIVYVDAIYHLPQPVLQPAPPAIQPAFAIQTRPPMRALLFPAETPSMGRAYLRAIAKNLIMTLLFPMCFIMVFFKNNRTAYDMITKTVVVESNDNPVLRRPAPQQEQPQQQPQQ